MTVSSTTARASYTGNGTTTVFAVPFYFLAAADLRVILRSGTTEVVQTLTTNYSVTGAGVASGGSVTMLVAPAAGTTLTILRNTPTTQETDLLPNDRLPAESLEGALDKLTMLVQQVDEVADRALQFPASDPAASPTIPAATARASKFLSFNASGLPVATVGVDASLDIFMPAGAGTVPRSVNDKLRDIVSIKDFGALGDGIADDTAAFNAAIAYANAKGGDDRANIPGSTIFIPEGRYRITSALSPVTVSSVMFVGASRASAVLLISSSTNVFTFGDSTRTRGVVGGGVSNVKVEYVGGPTGSATVFNVDYAFSLLFENIMLENIGRLARLGQTSLRIAGGAVFRNITGSVGNSGFPVWELNYGAGLMVSDCGLFVRGVLAPTNPASMTTVAGTTVFKCDTGFWDTVQVSNCIFERFDVGLGISAGNGMVYQNFFFTNTIMDYFRRFCVSAESLSGGVVTGIRFDDTNWFVSWETDAILLSGAGFNDSHHFSGTVVIAGEAGVNYAVSGARSVVFSNMQISACNRLGTVNAAMIFAAGAKGFTVTGCKGNIDTTSVGLAWRAPYGIQVGADADRYVITGCAFEGSTGGYNITANTSSSTYRRVFNNTNANYAGSSSLAMPSSGVSVTNTTPFVWDLDFFGGTITGGYDKNGVGYPGALSYVHMRLDPGDSFSCGYSVAPTLVRFIAQ